MTLRKNKVLVVCLLATVAACAARKPGAPLNPGFNIFSKEQDIELGREAAAQARQQLPIVQDQWLQNYIDRVGGRLAKQPEADQYPYTFTLVNDKQINAFALPGGPTFLNTGLILHAANEGQLAGVMAHEIAHVALRHGTSQASKANLIQLPAILAGAVIGQGSMLAQLAQLGIGLGANSVLLSYSRDAEREADALGARIMSGAGYNPLEMARFFELLEAEGGARGPEFLSSHPNPGNRMALVQEEIRFIPQKQYTGGTGEFEEAKRRAAQLPAPPAGAGSRLQSTGKAPAGAVGSEFRELRTPRFTLAYPAAWEVFGNQGGAAVTIAPRQGIVQGPGGGTSVGYGVMASYFFPETDRRVNLQQATQQLLHHLHATNPGMRVAGGQRSTRVAGNRALITNLSSPSPFGGTETNVLLTVDRPEGIFYLVLIAPAQEMVNVEPVFQRMLNSLRFS